ncbi:MAG: gliding motility-associated C-terminal domain-containing protein [Bacteroidota bacterium]|nr:gliding motility-associated C-terminal domain-containing protein [Bacteroidota bacterium]
MNCKSVINPIFLIVGITFFVNTLTAQTAEFSFCNQTNEFCSDDTVCLNNTSINYDYVKWNFGDDFETYSENPAHIYSLPGNYSISLIAYQGEASDTFSANLIIHPLPMVELNIPSDTFDLSLQNYVEISGDFDEILWSDNSTDNPFYLSSSGTYQVTVLFSETQCSVSTSFTVLSGNDNQNLPGIQVENNILTPNHDGINEVLMIKNIDDLSPCSIEIFNTNGNSVYKNTNYNNAWSGDSNQGNPLPTGTYYYSVKTPNMPVKTGFVDIIRIQ